VNDLKQFQECLATSGATVLQGPPSFWRLLIEAGWQGSDTLKIFCGGEAWPGGLARELVGKSSSVWNLYGPTETTVWSTVFRVASGDSPLSIGAPIANTQTFILDDQLQPVPVGVAGELHIGGEGLARGYLKRPELTAEKFIPNPFSDQPGARLYKTGDLARFLPDGNIEWLGRVDDQVKLRGYRIELGEIESVLGEHRSVQASAVVAREDSAGEACLAAYVVRRGRHSPTTEELRAFLKKKLPEYMVPARFEFLKALPLTPNGKVDRRALPPPGTSRPTTARVASPRTELEEKLAAVFGAVLRLERVGVDEDFFDLGGDSLSAVRLIHRVEKVSGHRMSLATLYAARSVSGLARLLADPNSRQEVPGALPLQPAGSRPPFFCLGAGAWFRPLANRIGPDRPFIGLVFEDADSRALPSPPKAEDIARFFLKKIRLLQPHGPYFLGSGCVHPLITYEIAQQLRTEGDEVLLVVMSYANPMNTPKKPPFEAQVLRQGRRISVFLAKLGTLRSPMKVAGYVLQSLKRKLVPLGFRLNQINHQIHIWTGAAMSPKLLGRALDCAGLNYRPQPFAGQIALIRPSLHFNDPELWPADLGWGELAKGGVDVHVVPGGLDEIFQEPKVEVTARELDSILMNAQRSGAKKCLADTVATSQESTCLT